jgi:hypothetical protein
MKIDTHEPVEIVCPDLFEVAEHGDTGIVDKPRKVIVFGKNGGFKIGDGAGLGEIDNVNGDLAAVAGRAGSDDLKRFAIAIDEGEMRTVSSELIGKRSANAACCAGE